MQHSSTDKYIVTLNTLSEYSLIPRVIMDSLLNLSILLILSIRFTSAYNVMADKSKIIRLFLIEIALFMQ